MVACECGIDLDYSQGLMAVLPLALWLTIAKPTDVLCPECIQQRLGRKLTESDFPDEPVPVYEEDKELHNTRLIPCNVKFFDHYDLFMEDKDIRDWKFDYCLQQSVARHRAAIQAIREKMATIAEMVDGG